MLSFAKAHGVTEADHLKEIEHWLPPSQRSSLLGTWRLAGWLTGAVPAMFGRQAVYRTMTAVENFVDQHYQQQIDHRVEFGGPKGLLPLLIRCQADEKHHRDDSAALAGDESNLLLRAWCWTVGCGSAAAVLLARRV